MTTAGSLERSGAAPDSPAATNATAEPDVYDRVFWECYLANFLAMTSLSMLSRYADFVRSIGGDETQMAWIVGVGALGAMTARLFQGNWIDRYGARPIWLASLAIAALAMAAHTTARDAYGPYVFVLRLALWTSVAGHFSASITFVSRRTPLVRNTEVVGTLGSSGFVGIILGPVLADTIHGQFHDLPAAVAAAFIASAGLLAAALVLATMATREQVDRQPPRVDPPVLKTVRDYAPPLMVAMCLLTGAGLNFPTHFVRPIAASLDIANVKTFFVTYGASAFVFRWLTRTWPQRFGSYRILLIGTGLMTVSMLAYLVVRDAWSLAAPALLLGAAHALLFPAAVTGVGLAFPERFRGVGTTLALAAFDAGNLLGSPLVGEILRWSDRWSLPKWPTAFVAMATIYAIVGAVYAIGARRDVDQPGT